MKLIRDVKGESESWTPDNLQVVKEERSNDRKPRDNTNIAKIEGVFNNIDILDRRLLLRTKQTGS